MGQKGGPDIPVQNLRLLVDDKNSTINSSSNIVSGIYKFIGSFTNVSMAGSGNTLSLTFSLSTSKINFGDVSIFNLTANISISAWIYPNSFGGGSSGRIYDKYKSTFPQSGYAFFIDNNVGVNSIAYSTGYAISSSTARINNQVTLNSWQHFAITHSGSTVTIYKNGEVIGTSTITAPTSASGTVATIGNNSAGTNNFDGKISMCSVYNQVLTDSEIKKIYTSTKSRYGL
jgi:hypothetical protein